MQQNDSLVRGYCTMLPSKVSTWLVASRTLIWYLMTGRKGSVFAAKAVEAQYKALWKPQGKCGVLAATGSGSTRQRRRFSQATATKGSKAQDEGEGVRRITDPRLRSFPALPSSSRTEGRGARSAESRIDGHSLYSIHLECGRTVRAFPNGRTVLIQASWSNSFTLFFPE